MHCISPEIASNSLLVVAAFIFVGGVIGFIKGKSKASIIAGTASSALLAGCYFVASQNAIAGYMAALVVLGALDVVFLKRLAKTKKFMPSGMLLVIATVEQFILISAF